MLFAFHWFLLFSTSRLQEGGIRTNPVEMVYCPLEQQKTPSSSFTACLLLYSQSAGAWLQHWTMLRLSMQAHTAKIPQWGTMTSSLYNCHPAPLSLFFMCHFLISSPRLTPFLPLVISPNTHNDVMSAGHSCTLPGCHVWDAVANFYKFNSTMYEL